MKKPEKVYNIYIGGKNATNRSEFYIVALHTYIHTYEESINISQKTDQNITFFKSNSTGIKRFGKCERSKYEHKTR